MMAIQSPISSVSLVKRVFEKKFDSDLLNALDGRPIECEAAGGKVGCLKKQGLGLANARKHARVLAKLQLNPYENQRDKMHS